LAILALSQATLGEGPDVGDIIRREGRLLQDSEVIYVGEDHIQLRVEFQSVWLNYSMEMVGDLFERDDHSWWDYQGPWYPGNETWWSFRCEWEARPGRYDATLVINRTYPDGRNETVPVHLVIDYVVAIEIADVYLRRSSDFFLVIVVETHFNCTDLEVWLRPMPHHDAEIEEWDRAFCPPGVYVFETPLPGGVPYPGAPPDNVDVTVWADVDGHSVEVFREEWDLRIEVDSTGRLMQWSFPAVVIALSVIVVLVLYRQRRARRDDDGSGST
jgi:hypothetical protein